VIAPVKSTIYPEFLPASLRPLVGGVRADQFTEFFRAHSDIPVINLREALLRAKTEGPVYHRTDTHWNFFGAWAGYREIIRRLSGIFPGAEAAGYDDFPKRPIRGPLGGDLASMLALEKGFYRERFERVFNPKGVEIEKLKLTGFNYPKLKTVHFKNPAGKLPKALFVHDSFGNKLRNFMSFSFSEIIFIWDWGFNFFPDLIERESPSIVIYELAERFLYSPAPVQWVSDTIKKN